MRHFTKEFIGFFRRLAKNNDREWFKARKDEYERVVKNPFEAFVEEVIDRVNMIDPEVDPDVKSAVFRIYRDTRFSRDKTPYKLHASAVITPGGRKDIQYPGLYLQLGGEAVWIMGGMYMPSKENLYAIRQAMADDPATVKRILGAKAFRDTFGEVRGERNKVLPKEFREVAADLPLIFNKQFYYGAEYPADTVLRKDFVAFVMRHYRTGKRFNDFLKEATAGV